MGARDELLEGYRDGFAELPEAIAKIRAERDEAVRLLRAWVHGTWSEAVEARGEARRLTTMEKRCG